MKEKNFAESDGDGWWVDFIESELDPSVLDDVRWLLKHSQADRQTVKEFEELRQVVAAADWGDPQWQEKDWMHLHDRIMVALEQTIDHPSSQASARV